AATNLRAAERQVGRLVVLEDATPSDSAALAASIARQSRRPTLLLSLDGPVPTASGVDVEEVQGDDALGELVAERFRRYAFVLVHPGAARPPRLEAARPVRLDASRSVDALARELAGLRVGVALGAGSIRGYAHLGVLRVLERAGVPVDTLAGSSV